MESKICPLTGKTKSSCPCRTCSGKGEKSKSRSLSSSSLSSELSMKPKGEGRWGGTYHFNVPEFMPLYLSSDMDAEDSPWKKPRLVAGDDHSENKGGIELLEAKRHVGKLGAEARGVASSGVGGVGGGVGVGGGGSGVAGGGGRTEKKRFGFQTESIPGSKKSPSRRISISEDPSHNNNNNNNNSDSNSGNCSSTDSDVTLPDLPQPTDLMDDSEGEGQGWRSDKVKWETVGNPARDGNPPLSSDDIEDLPDSEALFTYSQEDAVILISDDDEEEEADNNNNNYNDAHDDDDDDEEDDKGNDDDDDDDDEENDEEDDDKGNDDDDDDENKRNKGTDKRYRRSPKKVRRFADVSFDNDNDNNNNNNNGNGSRFIKEEPDDFFCREIKKEIPDPMEGFFDGAANSSKNGRQTNASLRDSTEAQQRRSSTDADDQSSRSKEPGRPKLGRGVKIKEEKSSSEESVLLFEDSGEELTMESSDGAKKKNKKMMMTTTKKNAFMVKEENNCDEELVLSPHSLTNTREFSSSFKSSSGRSYYTVLPKVTKTVSEWLTAQKHNLDLSRGDENEAVDNFSDADDEELYMCATQVEDSLFSNNNNNSSSSSSSKTNSKDPRESLLCNGPSTKKAPKSATTTTPTPPPLTSSSSSSTTTKVPKTSPSNDVDGYFSKTPVVKSSACKMFRKARTSTPSATSSLPPPLSMSTVKDKTRRRGVWGMEEEEENSDSDGTYSIATQIDRPAISARDIEDDVDEEEEGVQDDNNHHHHNNNNNIDDEDSDSYIACTQIDSAPRKPKRPDRRIKSKLVHSVLTINKPPRRGTEDSGDDSDDSLFSIATQVDAILSSTDNPRPWNNSNSSLFPKVSNSVPNTDSAFHPENSEFKTPKFPHRKKAFQWIRPGGETSVARDHRRAVRPRDDSEDDCEEYIIPASKKRQGKPVFGRVSTASPFVEISDSDSDDSVFSMATQHDSTTATPYRNDAKHVGDDDVNDDINVDDDDDDDEPFVVATQVDKTLELHSKSKPSSDHSFKIPMQPPKKLPQAPLRAKDLRLFKYTNDEDDDPYDSDDSQFSVATQLDVLPQPRGSKDQDLYLCDTQLDEGFVSPCKVKSDADDDAYTDDDDDDAFGSATQVDLVDSCKESSSKDKESPYSDFIFAIAATEPSHIPPQDGGTTHRRDADVDSRDGRQKQQQQHTTTATANASSKFASFMLGLGENSESGDDGKSSVTNVTKTSEIPPQRLKSRKEMRDSFRAKERSKSDRKNSSSGNNNSNPGKSPLNIFNSPAKLSVMESSTGPRKKRHRSPKWKKESRQKAKVIKDGIFSAKSRLEERFLMKSYDKTPARWTKTSRVIVGSSTNSSDVPLPNADQIKKLGLPLIETPKRRRSLPETLIKNHPEERLDTSRASSPVLDTSMSGNTAPNTPSPKLTSTTSPTPTSTTTNPLKTCYNISSHQSKTQPHSTTKSTQRVPLYENMGKCFAKDFNSFHIPKIKNSSPKTSPSDPTQTRPGSSLQDKPNSSCSTIQDLLYEVSLSKSSHNKPVISCDKTKPSNPKPVCPKQTLLCDIPLPKPPYSKPISPCDIPLPKSPNPNPDLSKPSQYKPLIPCDIPLPKPSNLKSYDIPTCKLCNIPNCNTSHTKHILLGSVPNYVPSSHKSSLRSNLVNTRQTSADTNPKKTVSFANKPVSMSVISAPPPLGGPCQPSRANNRHSDLLKHLLRWNTKWLQEQSKLQITPPVVSPDQLFPLLQSYLSYTDYFNIIRPLLLLEVWACVHKDYTEVERSVRSWQVACCNVCKTSPSEVDYIIYGVMSESDQMTNNYLMEGDCVILELPVTDLGVSGDGGGGGQAASTPTQYPVFGFVVKVNIQKPPQQSEVFQVFPDLGVLSSAMNNAKVFRAVIKCHYRKLSHCFTKLMKVQHVTNLTPFLRQYQALTKFVSNPLHSFILNPAGGGALVTGSSVSIDGNYNDSQKRAIAAAVEMAFQPQIKPSLCLVQGPPGTGKSQTIIGMIEKVKEKKPQSKIMLCAPSNGAIDELMRRLIDYKEKTPANQRVPLRFVRIGNTKSIHKDVVKYSLDELILLNLKQHGQKEPNLMNEINRYNVKLKQSQSEIERMRSGEKTSLRDEKIRKLQKDLRYIKTKIDLLVKQLHNHRAASSHPECSSPERATMRRSLLSKADVICGTLSACGSNCFLSDLANEYFTCVIVDEASQCCELDNLIPLQYNCNKMILIGDTEQLSPTVISQRAEEYNYGQSLFERLCKHYQQQKVQQDAVILLNVQYRMHPDICKFPNRYIYDNQLVSYSKLLTRSDTVPIAPYLLFDAQFGSHYRSADSGSLKNPLEADITVCLCECLSQVSSEPSLSIAVIAPYREQKRLLENRLLHRKLYNVDVTTVDGFQGRENDIIIMSCVRANTGFGNIGFLKDRRRLNVALTRAKFALYIVGHLSSLEGDEDWKSLIQDAQDRHLVLRVGRLDQFESVVKKCILTS
ncbi:hypothetical protein Ahia01_001161800 [Argonauta hians]